MTISAGENLEKMEPSCTVGRNVNWHIQFGGFPGGSDSKESACNAGDSGSVPELGRFPGKGNGYPFQYSCRESSMDREDWRSTVHGVINS